jgi:membrane-associated phospholipid phosphatase
MARRPLILLALAAGAAALAVIVWLGAFVAPGGPRLDSAVLRAFTDAGATPPLAPRVNGVAVLADLGPFLALGALLTGIALVRRRLLMAAVVPAVLIAANATTQILKPALGDPRVIELAGIDHPYPASWPSGHATAAMSLALCAVLVAGPRWRPLAAMLGSAYAVAIGYALVGAGWHLPSDVLGGYLVAAAYALLGAAVLAAAERGGARAGAPAPSPPPALAVGGPALGAIVVVGVAAVAVLARGPDPVDLASRHGLALLIGAGIAALAVALTAGLALVLRR